NGLVYLSWANLTVTSGSLFNLDSSALVVPSGHLGVMNNDNTLTINDGAFLKASNGSTLKLINGRLAFDIGGTNIINITNSDGCAPGCLATWNSIPNLDTTLYPVMLKNGAQATQVRVS